VCVCREGVNRQKTVTVKRALSVYIYVYIYLKARLACVLTLTLTQESTGKPPATRAALRSEMRTRAHHTPDFPRASRLYLIGGCGDKGEDSRGPFPWPPKDNRDQRA
jgi:hypothetical protein